MTTLIEYSNIALNIIEEIVSKESFLKEEIEILDDRDHDIKINQDKILSQLLSNQLSLKTKLRVLSEEDSVSDVFDDEVFWIIDPLDGSYNYLKGLSFYAMSIALIKNNKPVIGIVYDIPGDNTYYAIRGYGAFCNGVNLEKPKRLLKSNSIVMTGIPSYLNNVSELSVFWSELIRKQQEFKKVRMIGSATMSIISVINGIANHYFEHEIAFWDVAAAICIAEELGIECDYDFSNRLFNRVLVNNYD